jgi:hypothetical protein
MNFFEMIEKRQAQEPIKQDNSLTLDMVRRDWYRQGIDPDLATKAWEWAKDEDKSGSLAGFQEKFYDQRTGLLLPPSYPEITYVENASTVAMDASAVAIPSPDCKIGIIKRKPGRPKKVKA